MEIFKEVEILGREFLKAKKGIRISPEEIEEAKKIGKSILKAVDETADFIQNNDLADPIIKESKGFFSSITLYVSLLIIIVIIGAFIFFAINDCIVGGFISLILLRVFIYLICGLAIIIGLIILLAYYSKAKRKPH